MSRDVGGGGKAGAVRTLWMYGGVRGMNDIRVPMIRARRG
jgi:hypothetical protein